VVSLHRERDCVSLFREREMVVEAPGASGHPETTVGVSVKLSRTPGEVRTASVQFGQDTDKILSELGYSPEQIADFAETGVT